MFGDEKNEIRPQMLVSPVLTIDNWSISIVFSRERFTPISLDVIKTFLNLNTGLRRANWYIHKTSLYPNKYEMKEFVGCMWLIVRGARVIGIPSFASFIKSCLPHVLLFFNLLFWCAVMLKLFEGVDVISWCKMLTSSIALENKPEDWANLGFKEHLGLFCFVWVWWKIAEVIQKTKETD